MSETEKVLTIAQAAQRLGISERHLRRLLARPEYADQTRTLTRTTRTGTRTSAGLPAALLESLRVAILRAHEIDARDDQNADDADREQRQIHGQGGPEDRQKADKADIMPPFVSALLSEKDRRIEDLTMALEHEREAHRRAETLHLGTMGELQRLQQQAAELAAQNAKLIEALPSTANDSEIGPGDTQSNEAKQSDVVASAGNFEHVPKQSWWRRFLGSI